MPNKQRMKSWEVIAAPPPQTPTEKRGGGECSAKFLISIQLKEEPHTHTVQAALISH